MLYFIELLRKRSLFFLFTFHIYSISYNVFFFYITSSSYRLYYNYIGLVFNRSTELNDQQDANILYYNVKMGRKYVYTGTNDQRRYDDTTNNPQDVYSWDEVILYLEDLKEIVYIQMDKM